MKRLSAVPRSARAGLSTIDRRKEPVDVFKDSFAVRHDLMVLHRFLVCLIFAKRFKVSLHCFSNDILSGVPGPQMN
jgi:hypothetical protein